MKAPVLSLCRLGVLVAIAVLALVGCGRLNRTATINQLTTISGAPATTALEHQLASHGLSSAHVTCAKTLIVNFGATDSCSVTGAGKNRTVRFTFTSSHGGINSGSLKP